MTATRHMAPPGEGAGYKIPARDPKHEDPEWFQRDLDDPESDDPEPLDPLPTERHRTIPD